MFEAAVFSSLSTEVLKRIAGRERPFVSGDRSGFREGGASFPSGHVTGAFAIGAVLAESSLRALNTLCRERGILYVVDNTITSPFLFRPKKIGASIVINALTKSIGGHGNALGGSLTDTGLFDWTSYPNIAESYKRFPPAQWGLAQLRAKALRDFGGDRKSTRLNSSHT